MMDASKRVADGPHAAVRSMKVLVLHSELGVLRGGGENFTRHLFSAFSGRGHQVAAAFVANPRGRYPIPLPDAIEPIPIRGWWSRTFGQATLLSIGSRLALETSVKAAWDRVQDAICWRTVCWHNRRFRKRVMRRFAGRWRDFDVVYVHGDPILAADVARHRPTVLRLPGPVEDDLASVLRTIHTVCANGDVLQRMRQILGDRAIELSIGLDDRQFVPGPSSVRLRFGWTSDHQVVGYVGRLTHLKGVDLLAEAFREVSSISPEARLLIVGKGEGQESLRSMLKAQFAGGVVHVEEDVVHDMLPEWYRAMDLLVMPSRYENFSNAAIEGMACGVPVLASDVGGNRILAASGGVWLFEAECAVALAKGLLRVLSDRVELKARGCEAARSIRGKYSWTVTATRLEEIMKCHMRVDQ